MPISTNTTYFSPSGPILAANPPSAVPPQTQSSNAPLTPKALENSFSTLVPTPAQILAHLGISNNGSQPAAQTVQPSNIDDNGHPTGYHTAAYHQVEAEQAKNAGNEFRKKGLFKEAAFSYEKAIQIDPRYTDSYFNYAQLAAAEGNLGKATDLLTRLLFVNPNDHSARQILGEFEEKRGRTDTAKQRYLEILTVKPDFDPAKRRLNYLLYADQRRLSPQTADQLFANQYRETIFKARQLIDQFYTRFRPNPVMRDLAQRVPVVFQSTQQMNDTDNVAEWDSDQGTIRVKPQLMFSTPNIVAAYLVHELTHALDGDGLTSITEEQDSYRELARFWQIYKGAESDPNLDEALALYEKNPSLLDQEVRRVYSIQNPDLPEKSPGHGLPSQSPNVRNAALYDLSIGTQTVNQTRSVQGVVDNTLNQTRIG